jgi:parallel beta-helix repeat protein
VLGSVNADVKATGDWFDVDISSLGLKIDSGSFYAGWVESGSTYYNGIDADPSYHQRSWAYFPSYDEWIPFESLGLQANLMVRVRECSLADAPVQNVTTGRKYFGIQAAINTAKSGEQIVVNKGTYYENIYFKGKNLVVRSTDPNDSAVVAATVIKGGSDVVTFSGGQDENCVLAGFTITGGNRGIYCSGSYPTITNCVVAKNTGEGVYAYYASPTLTNCTITGNGAGGVAADSASEPAVANCTIVGNRIGGITVNWSTTTVVNSIIWSNWPKQITGARGAALITYSDVQDGWPALGNIDDDPCFASAGYWADANDPNIHSEPNEPDAIWVQGDYHLKSQGWRWNSTRREWGFDRVTSRAIDAGSPSSPLGKEPTSVPDDPGNIWGQNLRIDMGAFGGTAEASMPPHKWAILGDMTNDGTLDLLDLVIWAENWLRTNPPSAGPADLNRDRIVDMTDFALLAEDWLVETSWHD